MTPDGRAGPAARQRTLPRARPLLLLLLVPLAAALPPPGDAPTAAYAPPADAWCRVRAAWAESLLAAHPEGAWAPLRFEPTDAQLLDLGLPPGDVLRAQRYPEPTLVLPDGRVEPLGPADPVVYAGPGCLGIRPGGLLLTLGSGAIAWCTLGHAYGEPGAYQMSTAGHCGNVGDVATVIAGVGNRGGAAGVVLLDVGRFAASTGDGSLVRDWALVSIDARWQRLVSPTTCAWGGPVGVFTRVGDVVAVQPGNPWPTVTVNTDPTLAQAILHYGHSLGAGGPRVGQAVSWKPAVFSFLGHAGPGDAGSPANTLLGDAPGDQREAAGIVTRVLVDPSLRSGLGTVLGVRVSQVQGTLAEGDLVPHPAPMPGASHPEGL